MTIRCIIVDDEQLARELLAKFCEKVATIEVVALCKDPLEALDILKSEKIDLMFLDIQMPELTGIEFVKTLQNKPLIIFTTAYSEYALQGYELDIVDYLLKPISFDRFLQAVNRVTKHLQAPQSSNSDNPSEYLILKADHKIYRLRYSDILYIEGLKEYVSYYTVDQRIIVLQSLKSLESSLPQHLFLRIHKSYIINKQHVKAIEGSQVEITQKKIPIGKSYKEMVRDKIFN